MFRECGGWWRVHGTKTDEYRSVRRRLNDFPRERYRLVGGDRLSFRRRPLKKSMFLTLEALDDRHHHNNNDHDDNIIILSVTVPYGIFNYRASIVNRPKPP